MSKYLATARRPLTRKTIRCANTPGQYGVNTLWTLDADNRKSAIADTSKCRFSRPGVVVQLSR